MNGGEHGRDLDLGSADGLKHWAAEVREQTADIIAAALDATAPRRKRDLGRRAARRIIREAGRKLAGLLAQAGVASEDTIAAKTAPSTSPTSKPPTGEDEGVDVSHETIVEAWEDLQRDPIEVAPSMLAAMLGAITGTPGETAEIDTPGIAVLRAIRATADGWTNARGGSTIFASVSFADLDLMTRRIDAAIALLRAGKGAPVSDLDRAAEYAAAAEAWRAWCAKGPDREDTAGAPVTTVMLAALCEPAIYADSFTGDLIADVISGLDAFVRRVEREAERGGGGGELFVDNRAIEAWRRRLDALGTLRAYENAHREKLTRKLSGEKGGA